MDPLYQDVFAFEDCLEFASVEAQDAIAQRMRTMRTTRFSRMARTNRCEADRLSLRVVGLPNETRSMTSPALYMQEGLYTLVS
jgi:hypothetical protein